MLVSHIDFVCVSCTFGAGVLRVPLSDVIAENNAMADEIAQCLGCESCTGTMWLIRVVQRSFLRG